MSTEYVSRDEIEAHEATIQRMLEDEKKERESISSNKKGVLKTAVDAVYRAFNLSDRRLKEAIEAYATAMQQIVEEEKKEQETISVYNKWEIKEAHKALVEAIESAVDKMKRSSLLEWNTADHAANEIVRRAIEAYEAKRLRMVENEKSEQKLICDKKKKAIEAADKKIKMTIKAADKNIRKAIEAAQKTADIPIMSAETESRAVQSLIEQKLTVMQRDFDRLPLLRQVYHEAPDDVFELILSKCSDVDDDGDGRGGLNAFRLANKRLKQVVESCASMLINQQEQDGPDSLPIPIIKRCGRIEELRCWSRNLRSFEGCPLRIKKLDIGCVPHLSSDLSPLASCSMMESLMIWDSFITDISVVYSMPLLKMFGCGKKAGRPSIKDISPMSSCPKLNTLYLDGNKDLEDLSPLSACINLETLIINDCPLITSLGPLSFLKNLVELDCYGCPLIISLAPLSYLASLKELYCYGCPLITSLAPLSTLQNLEKLNCWGIDPQTSVLPLASCNGLEDLECNYGAVDLRELRRRRPVIKITEREIDQ